MTEESRSFTLVDDSGDERTAELVTRDDWETMNDPCPECGEQEFVHYQTGGGRFGEFGGVIIERSDYGHATRALLTRCRECGAVLFKHPAFDLLFETEDTGDGAAAITPE